MLWEYVVCSVKSVNGLGFCDLFQVDVLMLELAQKLDDGIVFRNWNWNCKKPFFNTRSSSLSRQVDFFWKFDKYAEL